MPFTRKLTLTVLVAGAFAVASIICGSSHLPGKQSDIQSKCCSKSSQNGSSSCSACPIALKSVDIAQAFVLTAAPSHSVDWAGIEPLRFKPAQSILTGEFTHGPPSFISRPPFYIQFHSLRI